MMLNMNIIKGEGFNAKYFDQANSKIIGVDFDDTITLHRPYPEKAPLNKKAKKYLDKLNKCGFILVLWTARVGKDYEDALFRCHCEFEMPYIKSDSDELVHGKTGKLVAKFYIDDRSYVNNKVPWRKIYKFLIKKYGIVNNNNV